MFCQGTPVIAAEVTECCCIVCMMFCLIGSGSLVSDVVMDTEQNGSTTCSVVRAKQRVMLQLHYYTIPLWRKMEGVMGTLV